MATNSIYLFKIVICFRRTIKNIFFKFPNKTVLSQNKIIAQLNLNCSYLLANIKIKSFKESFFVSLFAKCKGQYLNLGKLFFCQATLNTKFWDCRILIKTNNLVIDRYKKAIILHFSNSPA